MILERRVVVQQLLTGVFLGGCGSLAKARATARVDVPLCEPRKSRKIVVFFSTCRARECGWLLAAATSSEDGEMRDPVLPVAFFSPFCGQAIIAATGRRLWRRWSTAEPWEVRFANIARQSFAHFVSHYDMTSFAIRHHCRCTSSAKRRTLQVRASGLFVLGECQLSSCSLLSTCRTVTRIRRGKLRVLSR